jgi:hypothetical protein
LADSDRAQGFASFKAAAFCLCVAGSKSGSLLGLFKKFGSEPTS